MKMTALSLRRRFELAFRNNVVIFDRQRLNCNRRIHTATSGSDWNKEKGGKKDRIFLDSIVGNARNKAFSSSQSSFGQYEELPIIVSTEGVPIHLYAPDIDDRALHQLKLLAESPIPVDHVSAMPDAHWGMGVTIGCVFASQDYVCPNAVGVDIGCGMAAIPIDGLYKDDLSAQEMVKIQSMIKDRIPTGFNQHQTSVRGVDSVIDEITGDVDPTDFIKKQLTLSRVTNQLGTLGGGNHFLEVVYETKTLQVWILLHSGSRNIGNRTATHYDIVARQRLEKMGINTGLLKGIHYVPIQTQEGQDYLRDMEWCQRYAYSNRNVMKEIMLRIVQQVLGREADWNKAVNIHHNYCTCEDCGGGRKLWVTRKGATSAKEGEMGIIPGSMGDWIIHYAWERQPTGMEFVPPWSWTTNVKEEAHASISQEAFEESMRGIVCDTHPSVKDEAPQAYKDLTQVMKHSESLTDIVHCLLPIINVKGFESKLPKKYRNKGKRKKKN